MKRYVWDRYEEALLVDAYLNIFEKGHDRDYIIEHLSELLRIYGKSKGILIDDKYRNKSGISMKIGNMQYLFTEGKYGLSCFSKKDEEIYKLFKNNKLEFYSLLDEAYKKINRP